MPPIRSTATPLLCLQKQPKPSAPKVSGYIEHCSFEAMQEVTAEVSNSLSQDVQLLSDVFGRTKSRIEAQKLAQRILNELGDFETVLRTSPKTLAEVFDLQPLELQDLELLVAAALRSLKSAFITRPLHRSWHEVILYLRAKMGHSKTEQLRAIFVCSDGLITNEELLAVGTVDHVPVYPREVMRRVLETRSAGLVISHNHPTGDTMPSKTDITMTKVLSLAASAIGIQLIDHLIVGHGQVTSLRSLGKM